MTPEEASTTDSAPPFGTLLRETRKNRGWGQLRLVREMRAATARRGTALPTDASVKRRIASWENLHSIPDEFYGPLVCEALGMTAAELGLNNLTGQDTQLLETRYPPPRRMHSEQSISSGAQTCTGTSRWCCPSRHSPRGAKRRFGGS
ncbi:hypothetical protein SVIO_072740 [Streptomyces violaceusniger]|uniref:Uncharacterized protein n=1 Tax=Streptomyces violaceusniger TaxID=68280 RepID=A0A4D4L4W6_STRVO|nr:hypothetical protein SVIO_072740 [Streptomyces violaceusniger]